MAKSSPQSPPALTLASKYPYPASDASSMSSDVASEDERSSLSLADSTYEIVSNHPDQAIDHAEESDFTAPDDARSVDEGSDMFERDGLDETPQTPHLVLPNTVLPVQSLVEGQSQILEKDVLIDSAVTSGTIVPTNDPSASSSSFLFPSKPELPTASLKVPQALYPLHLGRPLRIVYHGPDSHKIEILDKIAQAVAASAGVESPDHSTENGFDNFSIISLPSQASDADSISSSGGRLPLDVTLIPSSGIEIAVQVCDLCRDSQASQQRFRCRTVDDKEAVCNEKSTSFHDIIHVGPSKDLATCDFSCHQEGFCKLHLKSETGRLSSKLVPDLAVFFHPTTHEHSGARTCITSCSYRCSAAVSKRGLPVIDIAEDRRFSVDNIAIYEPSLNMAPHLLERQPFADDATARPLDLQAFFALDTMDLNRNISLLTGLHNGLLSLDLPSFRGLRSRISSIVTGHRSGTRAVLSSLGLTIVLMTALIYGWTLIAGKISSFGRVCGERHAFSYPSGLASSSVVMTNARTVSRAAQSSQLANIEIESSAVAWSLTDNTVHKTGPHMIRLKTSTDEDFVVTLPEELSSLAQPPAMTVTASQSDNPLEVQLVNINASAAHIEMVMLRKTEPVKIVVSAVAKKSYNFTTVITCLAKDSNASAVQMQSLHSLASSLFGTFDQRWMALTVFEANRLLIMMREWLEKAVRDVRGTADDIVGKYKHLSDIVFQGYGKHNPLSSESMEDRAHDGKDAACIRRLLADRRHSSLFVAQLHCESKRLSQELARAWASQKAAYLPRLHSPSQRSHTLFDRYRSQVYSFRDVTLHKVRRRAQRISDMVKSKVNEAQARAKHARQRSSGCIAERAQRRGQRGG